MIYHITTRNEWERSLKSGRYIAPSLQEEGFIHASTRGQISATANRFYKGGAGLVLLCIDPTRLSSELKYERAPAVGEDFPHIYGPLNIDAVTAVVEFSPDPQTGEFSLPQGLP